MPYVKSFLYTYDARYEQLYLALTINVIWSHSLIFHISGSIESVSKQPTQLIVELNSSLWHIIVT